MNSPFKYRGISLQILKVREYLKLDRPAAEICHEAFLKMFVTFGIKVSTYSHLTYFNCTWAGSIMTFKPDFYTFLPSTDARLGRIVMAPSATLSWPITGEILEPQLSDPTHRKWPVWLFFLAASRTRLFQRKKWSLKLKEAQEQKAEEWLDISWLMI